MTPIDWLRLGARNVPTPPPAVLPVDDLAEIRARVEAMRWQQIDRSEPTCSPQGEHLAPAPEWDGSNRGMCRWSR